MFLIVSFLVNVFVFSQRHGKLIYSLSYVIITQFLSSVCVLHLLSVRYS